MMSKVYLMSTMITPVDLDHGPQAVRLRKASVDEARVVLGGGFISAVGHAGTAEVLAQLLGTPVPANRITVRMSPGDRAVHFALKTRLPEGAVLSASELAALEYDLVLSEVLAPAPLAVPTAGAGKRCLHCGTAHVAPGTPADEHAQMEQCRQAEIAAMHAERAAIDEFEAYGV